MSPQNDDGPIEMVWKVTVATACGWVVRNDRYMGGALRDGMFHGIVFPGHRWSVVESVSAPTTGECQDCDWTYTARSGVSQ